VKRNDIVELLRKAADELEIDDELTAFPGWDDSPSAYQTAIRAAARAIAADGLGAGDGTTLPVTDVGMLVRYIAEMLEE